MAVAIASHYFIPGFTWALGFVLVLLFRPRCRCRHQHTKGLGLNRRVVTILEGESLANDASALIAYKFAIAAIGTGTFVFWQTGFNFLVDVSGWIAIGIAIGFVLFLYELNEQVKTVLENNT